MDVAMELSRVLITELGDQQVIFLREKNGSRSFPIMIGISEVLAIDRRLKKQTTPRPMTHDLLANVIEKMGGEVDRIVIDEIRDHTFIATLHIRRGNEMLDIDSRPSDAIALGVAFDTPIYVSDHVLDEVIKEPTTMEDRLQMLRDRRSMLDERIAELSAKLEDEGFASSAPDELAEQYRRHLEEMRTERDAIEAVLKKLG